MKLSIRSKIAFNSLTILVILTVITAFTALASLELSRSNELLFRNNTLFKSIYDTLEKTQENLTGYLTAKNSDSLKEYIRWSSSLEELASRLNNKKFPDDRLLMEKNLRSLINAYTEASSNAVNAKRGRNIEVYAAEYEKTRELVSMTSAILDTMNLAAMERSLSAFGLYKSRLGRILIINFLLIGIALALSALVIYRYSFLITIPLTRLASSALELEKGNFVHEIPAYTHEDEIGTLYTAFSKMQKSIRDSFDEVQKKAELEQQLLVQKMETLEYKHKLKDSELLALQTQINPHFLFNTLSAGWQLALAEQDEPTAEFLQKLADFIRYALKPANRMVLVSEEIDCAKQYVWLLTARFGARFKFEFSIDDTVLDREVPALILQPLIENAVTHGLKETETGGIVRIGAVAEGSMLKLSVSDNGTGMAVDDQRRTPSLPGQHASESGIGLTNVIRRVELITGGNGKTVINSSPGEGTIISIYIPLDIPT